MAFTLKQLKKKYIQHKANAKQRGIGFELSLYEWLEIWTKSGHINQMGQKRYQYCMCRIGDKGSYRVGNVFIATQFENNSVKKPFVSRGNADRVWTDEMRANNSVAQIQVGNKPPSWTGKRHKSSTKTTIGVKVREHYRKNGLSEAQRRNPPPSWAGKHHSAATKEKFRIALERRRFAECVVAVFL